MIYPIDVHKQAQRSTKIPERDKYKFAAGIFGIVCVVLFFAANWFLKDVVGLPSLFVTILTLAIIVAVFITFFRYVILNEPARLVEYAAQDSDKFSKYVTLRKESEQTLKSVADEKVYCFEYISGVHVCTLQLRYGSNDQQKSKTTADVFAKIFHILSENNIPFRTIDMCENFEKSNEYLNYVNHLNSIEDKHLARHLLYAAEAVLNESSASSIVSTVYLMIMPFTELQLNLLDLALRQIFGIVKSNKTAFRSIHSLNLDELTEMMLDFYGLEAIDFSSSKRFVELSDETNNLYNDLVSIYRVEGEERTLQDDTVLGNKLKTNVEDF